MLRRLGDRGEGSLSYLTVILLIGAITAAVTVVAIPDKIVAGIKAGVCQVAGGKDCGGEKGKPAAVPSSGPVQPSGSPSVAPAAPKQETPAQRELREAQAAAVKAGQDARGVESEWNDFSILKEIAKLGLDFIAGDIINCIKKPKLSDCLWALLDVIPWTKVGKVLRKIPKVAKLIDRFLDLKRRLEKAREAKQAARKRLVDALGACTIGKKPNSFVPGTPVLMADGTRRPIERVRRGELVWATDPQTGRSGPRAVTELRGDTARKRLVDLVVDPDGVIGGPTSVITSTAEHPYWLSASHAWVDAGSLVFGDELTTPDGRSAMVVGTHERVRVQRVHNFTIAGLHTYYVLAGSTPLLVHNDGGDDEPCDAAWQGALHLQDEIARGNGNHAIPGIDMDDVDDVAKYLDDVMKTKGYELKDGGTAWYDPDKGYFVLKKNEYSGTGRQMTPQEWQIYLQKNKK
ncbi:polymorphic toxin-type HINT domain-containing protein [Actinomadura macrotermitis]|uniref:Hint domain-containing protein n=1 Tax=Actinomadura macrotermitis TaxID=2585200 RepID=A0A7K0C0W1_9ACTN|nr:polymorphic toxin-type HINT domain-containing protein [Actinomadura macrotermitis]MQY06986.1 hypothetical protein [Actinomadura macrotermitis]